MRTDLWVCKKSNVPSYPAMAMGMPAGAAAQSDVCFLKSAEKEKRHAVAQLQVMKE